MQSARCAIECAKTRKTTNVEMWYAKLCKVELPISRTPPQEDLGGAIGSLSYAHSMTYESFNPLLGRRPLFANHIY
ncbi:unnamed protein product [Toxocara canis]|uniref:Uncharacterized protein n=1 Tax=Toxocara canis TaxID=6265 RepID=A0A183UBL8_TOXCA|nr:unnamed protein product [Toxocara canis]